MTLITANEARALVMPREALIEKQVAEFRRVFTATIKAVSQGTSSKPGATQTAYSISAGTELMRAAKEIFMSEVRAAGYKVRLHDSSDDTDYFVYIIDWSESN
jgi:hypothetical protein